MSLDLVMLLHIADISSLLSKRSVFARCLLLILKVYIFWKDSYGDITPLVIAKEDF